MAVLVYSESENSKLKKSAFETTSYAKALSEKIGSEVICVSFNCSDSELLIKYGADKIINIENSNLKEFTSKTYSNVITQIIDKKDISLVILSSSADAKYLGSYLAGITDSTYVSNVVELPESIDPFIVKRSCFTNKAFSSTEINGDLKILSISSNSYGAKENNGEGIIEKFEINEVNTTFKVSKIEKQSGNVTIADADVVVSAGRGLKGPENWHMIEELAEVLGAATACSKPVSDMGWRPHSEHVGQTGKPVASNLYIAIGISGAIQHLAGINSSKVKLVINNDPEAPFFKAADYGVVGDAFEVIPDLIKKLKSR
jgi:electron transfer flavoprotein alpha subunit